MDAMDRSSAAFAACSRRRALAQLGLGFGTVGLALAGRDAGLMAAESTLPSAARPPHFRAPARRVIQIFAEGGPSHIDMLDPKPKLADYHGRLVEEVVPTFVASASALATGMGRLRGRIQQSGFRFQKHGDSGLELSELLPRLAGVADELCVIRSVASTSSQHPPAQLLMSTGQAGGTMPSLGSWCVYGLGTENANLPAFVAIAPAATTEVGDQHWRNAFLPPWAAGEAIVAETMTDGPEAAGRLIANLRSQRTSLDGRRRQLALLERLHDEHRDRTGGGEYLDGRLGQFETAFRMQVEALDAFDISREPLSARRLYGGSALGRQCLLARRLVERGVRFVQIHHPGWDTHDDNDARHRVLCGEMDVAVAALVTDLRDRGMLDDTLVLWGGEFGRTPTADINNAVEVRRGIGRDHNAAGFSLLMAGGGVRGGMTLGATDDFGVAAVEDRVEVHDLHATILHLLGLDHERLTFRHAGRDFRLTDVRGQVIKKILA
jgi:hypothetical protein